MAPLHDGATPQTPIERFKPTNGMITGYAALALCAFAVVYVAVSAHTATGASVALGFALAGCVSWVALLRPRAVAYSDVLRLKNSLVDVEVPLALIDAVTVRQTLNVWVGDHRYVCVGIGRSRRSMHKRNRPGGITMLLGMGRVQDFVQKSDRAASHEGSMLYETYVVTRIEDLVEAARKDLGGAAPSDHVRHLPAWPEIVALAVLAVAFGVISFAL